MFPFLFFLENYNQKGTNEMLTWLEFLLSVDIGMVTYKAIAPFQIIVLKILLSEKKNMQL